MPSPLKDASAQVRAASSIFMCVNDKGKNGEGKIELKYIYIISRHWVIASLVGDVDLVT